MKIITTGVAGTMESSDIIVTIEPKDTPGIELTLESDVMTQYGNQIKNAILETLAGLDIDSAFVSAVDKGALDCTVAARTAAAVYRAADCKEYDWSK